MLVSEEARVFQVRGLRCSKEPTVLGLSPVRLGNRTYRAWRTPKLTPMGNRTYRVWRTAKLTPMGNLPNALIPLTGDKSPYYKPPSVVSKWF